MSPISENLQAMHVALAERLRELGRAPESVQLLAVSKTFPAEAVLCAVQAGQRAFGENYVQEALEKIAALRMLDPQLAGQIEWHFIGPVQSNKSRGVAEQFAWVHSVDRARLADRLSEQRPAGMEPLNVCIQVNISDESSKSGLAPEAVPDLVRHIRGLPGLRLRGLMAIPRPSSDPHEQAAAFRAMRTLFEALNAQGAGLDTLSMGMSADWRIAVAEGSTLVRMGTAIFGARHGTH